MLAGVGLVIATPCQAASLSAKDVQVIAKSLGFLDPAPPGGVIAVVYSSRASKADADAVVASFGDGLASSGGTIKARSVDITSIGTGAGYIAIIMSSGVTWNAANIAVMTHGIQCITGNLALVSSAACIMAVQSDPRVSITVNRAAAQAAGIGFASAFTMLIHEI